MSDDDTRELPPTEPGPHDEPGDEATASQAAPDEGTRPAGTAGRPAVSDDDETSDEDRTMTIERPTLGEPTAQEGPAEPATTELPATPPPPAEAPTAPLPPAGSATTPLPPAGSATTPLPPLGQPAPSAQAPRAGAPGGASTPSGSYDATAGHIRVMSPPPAPVAPAPEPTPGLRVGTVVWGLVVAAVGVGLLSVAWGAHLDADLALIVLLGAAGVALLVGSLVGMRRSRNRAEGRG